METQTDRDLGSQSDGVGAAVGVCSIGTQCNIPGIGVGSVHPRTDCYLCSEARGDPGLERLRDYIASLCEAKTQKWHP